jgi:tetratricopeptide (TPR) repeat protein
MKAVIVIAFLIAWPGFADAWDLSVAVDLYQHGQFQAAADMLSGLVKQNPGNADMRIWFGKSCMKLRRWDDAILQFTKATEIDPKNGVLRLWLGRAYGNKADHASFFSAFGLARDTVKAFETAAQLSPANTDIRFDLLEFYIQAPGLVGGGKDKAEAQAREIAKLSPRLGYAARARMLEDAKDWERAQSELAQAAVQFPKDASAFADLAAFCMRRRMFPEAEEAAQKAVALGGSKESRVLLAAAQVEGLRDVAGALKALQEIAAGTLSDDDPGFEEVYYWLGRAWLAQSQNAEARKAFETSLRFDPDYGRSRDALKRIRQVS